MAAAARTASPRMHHHTNRCHLNDAGDEKLKRAQRDREHVAGRSWANSIWGHMKIPCCRTSFTEEIAAPYPPIVTDWDKWMRCCWPADRYMRIMQVLTVRPSYLSLLSPWTVINWLCRTVPYYIKTQECALFCKLLFSVGMLPRHIFPCGTFHCHRDGRQTVVPPACSPNSTDDDEVPLYTFFPDRQFQCQRGDGT